MKLQNTKRIMIILLCFFLLVNQVQAISIGVNKASIIYEDVLRGGFARQTVTITTDSENPISGELLIGEGEMVEWVEFSDLTFNFSKSEPYKLVIDVLPPTDAEVKDYRLNVSILTGALNQRGEGRFGTEARASIGIKLGLFMTGNEIVSCKGAGVKIRDAELNQPTQFDLTLQNNGNVRLNPTIIVDVYDRFRSELLMSREVQFGETIFPTLQGQTSKYFQFDLGASQYWAEIRVPQCDYVGGQYFDLLDVGGIKDEGEFIRIDAPSIMAEGEIGTIKAIFRNTGSRGVRANFRGTITRIESDEIVKVINTDQYLVDPSATAEIETFFNPQVRGTYRVSGRVFYNDKLTLERDVIVNVGNIISIGGDKPTTKIMLFLIVIIVIILFLLILIKKKKKKQQPRKPVRHMHPGNITSHHRRR